jgi:hypothetical protein
MKARGQMHDSQIITLFETDPNEGIHRGYCTTRTAKAWLDYCVAVLTEDPVAGLRVARTAVRITLRLCFLGNPEDRCLHVKAVSQLAHANRALERLSVAETTFKTAFKMAGDCPCCLPGLHRKFAYLRSSQLRPSEAFKNIEIAISLYKRANDAEGIGRGLMARGMFHAVRGSIAPWISDYRTALELVPPTSRVFHSAALQGYTRALSLSEDPAHLDEAAELLPEVEKRYKGLRDLSLPRAILEWTKGGIYGRQARIKPGLDRWQQHGLRLRSAHHLEMGLDRLVGLKTPLPLEIAAITADRAAVQAELDRFRVTDLLESVPLCPPEFRELLKKAAQLAGSPHDGAAVHMWAALRELRDATVAAGCAPPLVPYASRDLA